MFAFKIVLVGDFATGKSSLVRRFVENSFSEDYISSIGVSISRKTITTKEHDTNMMIWDIEGQTEYKPIFKQYLLGAKGFVIVADLTRKKTIENIKEHIKLCEEICSSLPICIALNKLDIASTSYNIQDLKKLSNNIIQVYETSAKEGTVVEDMFVALNNRIIEVSS